MHPGASQRLELKLLVAHGQSLTRSRPPGLQNVSCGVDLVATEAQTRISEAPPASAGKAGLSHTLSATASFASSTTGRGRAEGPGSSSKHAPARQPQTAQVTRLLRSTDPSHATRASRQKPTWALGTGMLVEHCRRAAHRISERAALGSRVPAGATALTLVSPNILGNFFHQYV